MDFVLSKLIGFLIKPSSLFLILSVIVWLWPWRSAGRGRALVRALPVGLLLAIAFLPVGQYALLPLEEAFEPEPRLPPAIDGIMILGGSVEPTQSASRGMVATNEQAERLHQGLRLALLHPEAKLVHSGGNADIGWRPGMPDEAMVTRMWFEQLGFPVERLILENRSRNTRENAIYSLELLQPAAGEVWVLVTSAAHMPRSLGVFEAVGWPMIPWPCAFETARHADFDWWQWVSDNLKETDIAAHEWTGLLYYMARGWVDRTAIDAVLRKDGS